MITRAIIMIIVIIAITMSSTGFKSFYITEWYYFHPSKTTIFSWLFKKHLSLL